jgi:hypothetical protein
MKKERKKEELHLLLCQTFFFAKTGVGLIPQGVNFTNIQRAAFMPVD